MSGAKWARVAQVPSREEEDRAVKEPREREAWGFSRRIEERN